MLRLELWIYVDRKGRDMAERGPCWLYKLRMEHGIEEKAETDDMELSRKTQEGAQRAQPYLGS
ncbi:MAG: hypothetical protein CL912_01380 [Deltaproteobacteria bacterium]|nr:hypothetical protein [Deltaproteobacteria bacterium]